MSDSTEPLKDRIRRVADEFEKYVGPDGKVNATALVDRIEILTAEGRELREALRETIDRLVRTNDFKQWVLDGTADLTMFNVTTDGETMIFVHKLDSAAGSQK